MKNGSLVVAVLGVLIAAPATEAATPRSPVKTCPTGTSVLSSSGVKLIRTKADSEGSFRYWACVRPRGKAVLVQSSSSDINGSATLLRKAAAGRYVAVSAQRIDQSCKAACDPDFDGQTDTVRIADPIAGTVRTISTIDSISALRITSTGATTYTVSGPDGNDRTFRTTPKRGARIVEVD